jgi:hypothetical protein
MSKEYRQQQSQDVPPYENRPEEMGTCDLVSKPHRRDHCGEAWRPLTAQEALCGTAANVDTSTNTAILPTVKNASPSGEALLPETEWASLSLESQHKLQTWYRLATERLQAILDSDEFAGDSE